MRVGLDYSTIKAGKRFNPSNPISAAFKSLSIGISEAGHEVIAKTEPFEKDEVDCVFVFGSITQRKKNTERAISIQKHRDNNTTIFALDSAFFSTYIREKYNVSETYMFRVGLNDCVGEANWLNQNSPPDRYEALKQYAGFEEKEVTADNDKPILFLLQSEKGWQYDSLQPYYVWARTVVDNIRRKTDRKIILRAHPNLDRNPTEYIARGFDNIEIERCGRNRIGVINSIRNAGAVVTHSSSATIESYVEGIPTFSLDSRCVIHSDLDNDFWNKINNLESYNWDMRQQKLWNWAYTSWHVDELKRPEVLERYLSFAQWLKDMKENPTVRIGK